MLTLHDMKNTVASCRIPLAQNKPACCAISVYTCLMFKHKVIEDLKRIGNGDIGKVKNASLQKISTDGNFFVKNIRKGLELWAIAITMRDFTSSKVVENMSVVNRAEMGLPTTKFVVGVTPISDYRSIKSRLDKLLSTIDIDVVSVPDSLYSSSILDHIYENVNVPKVDVMAYLHIDEIFANAPGLHWIDFSDKVWNIHMLLPKVSGIQVQKDITRLIDEVEQRHKDEPRLFKRLGESFRLAYDYLIQMDAKYMTTVQCEEIIEVGAFVYRLDRMLNTNYFKESISDPENAVAQARGDLNPVRDYTVIDFIETVLNRRMNMTNPKARHMRAFVFTRGATSTSVLCNTENSEFIIFDSHGTPSSPSDPTSPQHSTTYYSYNRYGFYKLICYFYMPHLLSPESQSYIDISEIDFVASDFDILRQKCEAFGSL